MFQCFSCKYGHLLGKYNVSFGNRIHDGICLPLYAVRALNKLMDMFPSDLFLDLSNNIHAYI